MPRSGARTFCCGAGGGGAWVEVRQGSRIAALRMAEARETGRQRRGHRVPFCALMLEGETQPGDIAVRDVAELLVGEPAGGRGDGGGTRAESLVIALVLVHAGSRCLARSRAPAEPAPDRAAVGHRGGDRLVVTARADRAALEWALALTDRAVGPHGGSARVRRTSLAWALGPGATTAVRIWDDALDELDLAAMARVVAAAVRRIAPDVVVAGERGLAGATGALPALVAAHLGWPCVDGAIRLGHEEGEIVVERRLRGGRREELAVPWPGVVTVTADSVEPRYVSVRARRDAARRGHETWSLADLGLAAETGPGRRSGSASTGSTGRGRGRAGRPRPPPPGPLARPPTASASWSAAARPPGRSAAGDRRRARASLEGDPGRSPTASWPSWSSRLR